MNFNRREWNDIEYYDFIIYNITFPIYFSVSKKLIWHPETYFVSLYIDAR